MKARVRTGAAGRVRVNSPGRGGCSRAGRTQVHRPRKLLHFGSGKGQRKVDMKLSDLEKSALQLNELYEQLEIKRYGRIWTTEELALGFVGDVGDLAKLIQANAGIRDIADCKTKLGHELSDCLMVDHCSCKQVRH